jgi:hypothetical protein
MSYRLIYHHIINVSKQDLRLFKPQMISRSLTTQSTISTRRWAIRRYVLLIGLPLTSFLVYRLSTKLETRRKHHVVLGSIGRAFR